MAVNETWSAVLLRCEFGSDTNQIRVAYDVSSALQLKTASRLVDNECRQRY